MMRKIAGAGGRGAGGIGIRWVKKSCNQTAQLIESTSRVWSPTLHELHSPDELRKSYTVNCIHRIF